MFAVGIGGLALVASATCFILYFHFKAAIGAYEATAACASPADATSTDCRYAGAATVLSSSRTDQLRATVRFDALPDRTFTARFPSDGEPGPGALIAGAATDAELWSGKVSRLAGKPTSDNPESTSPASFLPVGWFLLTGALAIFGLSVGLARVNFRIDG